MSLSKTYAVMNKQNGPGHYYVLGLNRMLGNHFNQELGFTNPAVATEIVIGQIKVLYDFGNLGATACCGATHYVVTGVDAVKDDYNYYTDQFHASAAVLKALKSQANGDFKSVYLLSLAHCHPDQVRGYQLKKSYLECFKDNFLPQVRPYFEVSFDHVDGINFLLTLKPKKEGYASISEFQAAKV